jgi:hypothetical protein
MRRLELALLKSNQSPIRARRLPARPCARKGENFGGLGQSPSVRLQMFPDEERLCVADAVRTPFTQSSRIHRRKQLSHPPFSLPVFPQSLCSCVMECE